MGVEELRDKVSIDSGPMVYEIEKGMVRRFVEAIGDPNPLWQNKKYARQSTHGSIIAPPTLLLIIGFEWFGEQLLKLAPLFKNLVNGGTDLECYQPIRSGDVVTATIKMTEVSERQGKTGKITFMTFETTYQNQTGQLVGKCHQIAIGY